MRNRRYNKYHSKKTIVDGISFDSMKEAKRYTLLKEKALKGQIMSLERQVPFELIPNQYIELDEVYKKGEHKGEHKKKLQERKLTYVADFVYRDSETGKLVVEDTKGFRTSDYIIKRKLMLFIHGIIISEI